MARADTARARSLGHSPPAGRTSRMSRSPKFCTRAVRPARAGLQKGTAPQGRITGQGKLRGSTAGTTFTTCRTVQGPALNL